MLFLLGDDSTQAEDNDDIEVIQAPQPSKWERDDSESDTKLKSPAVQKTTARVQPAMLDRCVIIV